MALAALGRVDDVDIEASGKFKYILIRLAVGDQSKYIVRGYSHCEYHGKKRTSVTES